MSSAAAQEPRGLGASAAAVLAANDNGGYTRPSRIEYPHQWNWDSALIALGWAALAPGRAYTELETLLGARDRHGMVPHIAFQRGARGYLPGPSWWGRRLSVDGRRISGVTQVPVAATCLRLLHERHPRPARTRALLAPLHAWHRFLLGERRQAGGDEPVLIHPWESGRDNAAEWDRPLRAVPVTAEDFERWDNRTVNAEQRPVEEHYFGFLSLVEHGRQGRWRQRELATRGEFRVLDPGFSALLAAACQDLAALAGALGEDALATESEALALGVAEALQARAGADGLTRAFDLATGESLEALGAGVALTVLSPRLSRRQVARLRDLLLDGELSSPHGVRSLAAGDPGFEPVRYWRGPVWANITWLCALGLERHGQASAAALLRRRMLDTVAASGMREYVHPDTGRGLGVGEFSWTAALTLWELEG